MSLVEYVVEHTVRGQCQCGHCVDNGPDAKLPGHTSDLVFFEVAQNPDNPADADDLRKLLGSHRGEFCECNLLDGNEHNYMEIGGWIGSQDLALRLMGLGNILGLWDLLTPITLLKLTKDDPFTQQMAGMGMVAIQVRRTA